jgi:PleD family two-component response regulator
MGSGLRIFAGRSHRPTVAWLAIAALGAVAWVGCDMGLDQPANRYEQLNQETKKLLNELKQVTDEKTANEHRAALEEAAANIRRVQEGIVGVETNNQGGGMARITNHRQATMWMQIADGARRQTERIREADAKAGAIVDKALEGVIFPKDSGL